MSWESIIFDAARSGDDLSAKVSDLLAQQCSTWPAYRRGEAALANMSTKELVSGGSRVIIQANPARARSTNAKVDAASIAKRPCFLCPENIPPEERGIAYGELVILPNPYPILSRHLTIAKRDHIPQRHDKNMGLLLELARDLGDEMLVLYNGPRCGASAPDHFHFQACSAGKLPLLGEVAELVFSDEILVQERLGRRFLVCRHQQLSEVVAGIDRIMSALAILAEGSEEPPVNIIATYRSGLFTAHVFPRRKLRPDCFFAEDEKRIAVSPGSLEMGGLVVVSEPAHMNRIDAETIKNIFHEVSIGPVEFAKLAEMIR